MKSSTSKSIQKLRRHARIRSRISGTSERPRLVVFRSLRFIQAQLIDDISGKTLAAANDMKVKKGTKIQRAKTVGEELAKNAEKAKITTCVFDRNGYKYHGRVKALAEGAREAGLKF